MTNYERKKKISKQLAEKGLDCKEITLFWNKIYQEAEKQSQDA